jgi:acyl-[acyl-carrier-protein]-phospholipid O-acyltransferase/long-chain-fatty-acid--[acyl-carrier-protein] ligase
MKIEDQVQQLLEDGTTAVVVSVPDDVRGERLLVFYTDPRVTPQQLWERLSATPLPRLWIPKRDDFRYIETIPTLGSGKVDLRALRGLTAGRFPPDVPA